MGDCTCICICMCICMCMCMCMCLNKYEKHIFYYCYIILNPQIFTLEETIQNYKSHDRTIKYSSKQKLDSDENI